MSGLPPIADTLVPAAVREAGDTKVYKAALGFESMMLDQLTKTMVQDSDLADSPYADQISGSFSQGLLQGGGIGLAGELYRALKQQGKAS